MENPLRDRPAPRGLTLIETGYWDGAALRHEHLHRARLGSGAAALGWTVPDFHVSGPDRPARWRLTLDAAGVIRQEHHPLPPDIDTWRVGLSDLRLASDDPWLRLKSSQRATYDAARAALPQGLDEVILLNERDEVCDGTITTVFFSTGARGCARRPWPAGCCRACCARSLLARKRCFWPAICRTFGCGWVMRCAAFGPRGLSCDLRQNLPEHGLAGRDQCIGEIIGGVVQRRMVCPRAQKEQRAFGLRTESAEIL